MENNEAHEGEEEDDFTKEYYRKMDEALERKRETARRDDEALKHEVWSCKVGDHLEQTAPLDLWDRDDEAPTVYQPDGQIYRVDELKGRCFYLGLVSGVGAKVVGIWNADVPKYFRAAPRAEAISNPQQS